jgi:hypothetical protein
MAPTPSRSEIRKSATDTRELHTSEFEEKAEQLTSVNITKISKEPGTSREILMASF